MVISDTIMPDMHINYGQLHKLLNTSKPCDSLSEDQKVKNIKLIKGIKRVTYEDVKQRDIVKQFIFVCAPSGTGKTQLAFP